MKIKRLRAKNCSIYESLDIDLSNITLASVTGLVNGTSKSNSAGKSSIFRILHYVLTGSDYSGQTVDSLMREGCDCFEASLEFDFDGDSFYIRRSRKGKQSEAELLKNYELLASGVRNVAFELQTLFRLTPEILGMTIFFVQGGLSSFTELLPSARKTFLSSILALDEWTKFHKIAKEKLQEQTKQITNYDAELGFYAKNINKNTNFDERIALNKQEIVKWEQTLIKNQSIVDNLIKRIKDFETTKHQKQLHDKAMQDVYSLTSKASLKDAEARKAKIDYSSAQSKLEDMKFRRADFQAKNRLAGETYSAKISRLQLANERLTVEIEMLEHIVGALGVMHDSSDKEREKCPICKRTIIHGEDLLTSNSIRVQSAKKDREDNIVEINKLKLILDENMRLERNVEKLEQDCNLLFVKSSSAEEIFRQAKETLNKAKESTTSFAQMMLNPGMTEDDYVKAKNQRDEMRHFAERDQAKLTSARVLEMNIQMEKRSYEETCKKIADIEKKKVDVQEEAEYTAIAVRMFSNSNEGIPMCIIDEAVEKIQSEANEFLKEYEAPFFIQLDTTKYTKEGEARDTLDINILTHSQEKRPYNVLCGAEKAQVDIALRFALSMLLCDRYDVSFESLYIDEALSAFDEYNKEITLKIFKVLAKRFSQIFVISHDSSIRDVLPQSIVVTRTGDKSEVQVYE